MQQEERKTWREIDERKGKYMTVEKLVMEYGYEVSPAKACERASRYATKCAKMGGKWIMADKEFSGLMHFLKMNNVTIASHEDAKSKFVS